VKENGVEYRCKQSWRTSRSSPIDRRFNEEVTSEGICDMFPLHFLVNFNSTKESQLKVAKIITVEILQVQLRSPSCCQINQSINPLLWVLPNAFSRPFTTKCNHKEWSKGSDVQMKVQFGLEEK